MFGFGRVRFDLGGGQYGTQKQPVAVGAAEQIGVFALPAQAGALGQRLLHQGGGVDEDLDVGAVAGRDLTRQLFQPTLDDLVIVVAARIDRDVSGRAVGQLVQRIVIGTVVHAQDDGGLRLVPHGRGMLAAIQRRLHPVHVAMPARVHEMTQPLARRPGVGRRGEPADIEAQLGRALADEGFQSV